MFPKEIPMTWFGFATHWDSLWGSTASRSIRCFFMNWSEKNRVYSYPLTDESVLKIPKKVKICFKHLWPNDSVLRHLFLSRFLFFSFLNPLNKAKVQTDRGKKCKDNAAVTDWKNPERGRRSGQGRRLKKNDRWEWIEENKPDTEDEEVRRRRQEEKIKQDWWH